MSEQTRNGPCPLCHAAPAPFAARQYFRCPDCALVFLDPAQHPSPDEELARYRQHRNSADDAGYIAFLSPLVQAVQQHAAEGATGIDFGCGPAPVLSQLLTAAGYPTAHYDPYFFPDASVLDRRYDFITCSEVAEHAFAPRQLFEQMRAFVEGGGIIAVSTLLYDDVEDFANWWYVRDSTHVSFYSAGTMQWIAKHFGWTLTWPELHIALFSVPQSPA